MQIGEHLERIIPNRRTCFNSNQALPPNLFEGAFGGLTFGHKKITLYIVCGFESQKLPISRGSLSKRLQFEKGTKIPESICLLRVEMLYGDEIFKNADYRKKSTATS